MPKKKSLPKVIDSLWVIYNPSTNLYFKAVTNNRRGRWNAIPFIYSSEKKLMTGLEYLRRDKCFGEAVVFPYDINESTSIPAKVYGE